MFMKKSKEQCEKDEANLDEWWNALSSSDKYHIQRYISDMDSKSIRKANEIVDKYKKERFWKTQEAMGKAFEENKKGCVEDGK